MRTEQDVEAFLLRMHRRFSPVDGEAGTYLVQTDGSMPPLAVRVDPPLVVFRIHIGDLNKKVDPNRLFRTLLEFNANGLVFSSYGLDNDRILLSSALELENLDFNEMQAVLDEIDLALAQQVPKLAELNRSAPPR